MMFLNRFKRFLKTTSQRRIFLSCVYCMAHVIGLTGGIASGKSTVMSLLQAKGVPALDADDVVHQLYQQHTPLMQQIAQAFGPDVLTANGIDRKCLGQRVFNQPEALARLGQLVHPAVRQAMAQFVQAHDQVVVLVIPLLYEHGLHTGFTDTTGYTVHFDAIWLCAVPEAVQRQRLIQLRHLTPDDADNRLASQMSLNDKLKFSPTVIDCNGTIESTRQQVHQLLAALPA
jgi:dephospho-CoA kinase